MNDIVVRGVAHDVAAHALDELGVRRVVVRLPPPPVLVDQRKRPLDGVQAVDGHEPISRRQTLLVLKRHPDVRHHDVGVRRMRRKRHRGHVRIPLNETGIERLAAIGCCPSGPRARVCQSCSKRMLFAQPFQNA